MYLPKHFEETRLEVLRELIHAHPHETLTIPFPEGAVDVDTPGDFARVWAFQPSPR